MKIAIIDTYYPEFLSSLPPHTGTYREELGRVLNLAFGTGDFFSHNLKAQGWECQDMIVNSELQRLWAKESGWSGGAGTEAIGLGQMEGFQPDVVFLQDISCFNTATLRHLAQKYVLALQCSCAFTANESIRQMDVVFTSLPTHIPKFKALGVDRVEYLPLAFDPRMLPAVQPERDIDISFVGGVGRNSHWQYGTDVLEAVAERFKERFFWYGYGLENLSMDSPLRACYRGPCWGKEMYSVYSRSKIVVNRHGEISGGYTNNLRCYEATGCGALLMTEASKNRMDLFPPGTAVEYTSAKSLCDQIELLLNEDDTRALIAKTGQEWTLANHTYSKRMPIVSKVLTECLERRQVAQ